MYTASECLFMVSMAMSYFFSYQTYAVENFKPGAEMKPVHVVVGVDLKQVAMEVIGHHYSALLFNTTY